MSGRTDIPAEFKRATPAWHNDVEDVIMKLQSKNASGNDDLTTNNAFLDSALDYVQKTNPFPNAQAARQAKLALAAFNQEYDNAISSGMEPPHPRFDDRIATMAINLRLFDVSELLAVFPALSDIFSQEHYGALQALLDNVALYATNDYKQK